MKDENPPGDGEPDGLGDRKEDRRLLTPDGNRSSSPYPAGISSYQPKPDASNPHLVILLKQTLGAGWSLADLLATMEDHWDDDWTAGVIRLAEDMGYLPTNRPRPRPQLEIVKQLPVKQLPPEITKLVSLPGRPTMNKWTDPRQTPEAKANLVALMVDQMTKGWTDRGIKRDVVATGLYKATDDTRLQEVIDGARAQCKVKDPDPDGHGAAIPVPIIAAPYVWTNPEKIPLRDWLYGRLLVRKYLSMTIASGGVGKSSLIAVEVLAMISGMDLLGVRPPRRLKVWLWNLEDPQEETTRKIQAAAKHYKLTEHDIGDRLFVNSGRDTPMVIAKTLREGAIICHPVIDNLVEQVTTNEIDVLIVDPFVSCHEVSENDNSAIDMVAKQWSRVAEIANCAILLVHHTRKAPVGTEVTAESGRGAKALTDAARVARALTQMSEKEGKTAGVENHRLYFRTYNDKANLAPPMAKSDWYKLESVALGNGAFYNSDDGDSVGVVTKWEWPETFDGLSDDCFAKVIAEIQGKRWRKDSRSDQWVGKAVAKALQLDLVKDRAKILGVIKAWFEAELLSEVEGMDEARRVKKFVVITGDGPPDLPDIETKF